MISFVTGKRDFPYLRLIVCISQGTIWPHSRGSCGLGRTRHPFAVSGIVCHHRRLSLEYLGSPETIKYETSSSCMLLPSRQIRGAWQVVPSSIQNLFLSLRLQSRRQAFPWIGRDRNSVALDRRRVDMLPIFLQSQVLQHSGPPFPFLAHK
jgi:hypothetical protein